MAQDRRQQDPRRFPISRLTLLRMIIKMLTITMKPAVKPDVEMVGGKCGEPNETLTNAYVDGNLVTAAAWPAHPEWMKKFLELLGSKVEA